MMNEINMELLTQLFGKIERAWVDRRDRTIVYTLAEEYPEYKEALYEFFDDLLFQGLEDCADQFSEAEQRIADWLQNTGIEIALSAAVQNAGSSTTTPNKNSKADGESQSSRLVERSQSKAEFISKSTWVMFLRQRTQEALPNIVKKLENVTTEYLVLVSRHPHVVPEKAKELIATEIERAWGIPAADSIQYLVSPLHVVRAASRSRPFEKEPNSFEELLVRAALSKEQVSYWLEIH